MSKDEELQKNILAIPEVWAEDTVDGIKALMHTEKLKLLAEIRERVVGEDHLLFGHGEDWVGAEPQNSLKREQRIELTKLEAEL